MAPKAARPTRGKVRELVFDDRQSLAEALASSVADSLYGTLTGHARASLVVSGGSTPTPFFRHLRTLDLPWRQVDITLADERWVDADHPASNERFIRSELLRDLASSSRFTPLKIPDPAPEAGAAEAARRIETLRPFDVAVLGMGGDGHTASLFPDDPHIAHHLQSSALTVPARPPSQELPRLSLTPAAFLGSRRLILHITGEAKREVYRRAKEPGPAEELPIRAFLRGPVDLDVYWAP